MLIRRIGVQGMAGLANTQLSGLDGVVRVSGPRRARQALADALRLVAGAWSLEGSQAAFEALGSPAEVVGEGLPDEIHLANPQLIAPLLDPQGDRTLRVELELELDPPQFRTLREQAVRHPELVDALAGGALLSLGLGWVFTRDFSVAALSIHRPRLGEVALDLDAPWLEAFLAGLAGRVRVQRPMQMHPRTLDEADRSPDPSRRRAMAALREALRKPPLGLGELHLVADGDRRWLAFGEELAPLRSLGGSAREEVATAASVFLEPAEILVVDKPFARSERSRALQNWLARQTGEGAPLDQVWMLGLSGGGSVEPRQAESGRGLRFPVRALR